MRWSVVICSILFLLGCSTTPDASSPGMSGGDPDISTPSPKESSQWPTGVTIHKNAAGEVECPIMEAAVKSPDRSVGYQDYNGVRYYFCCDMCPEKFRANPSKYAEKPKDDQKVTAEPSRH